MDIEKKLNSLERKIDRLLGTHKIFRPSADAAYAIGKSRDWLKDNGWKYSRENRGTANKPLWYYEISDPIFTTIDDKPTLISGTLVKICD